ncbi:unnamed protein product [Rangifer tarandus platyrhynchus]|uniref:Uncharacterized protein n=1 Tax=Rangifer tarandus platyrhynchus TaxID=3082113 RepID=A0AC59Y413_RANTA
MRRLPAMHKEPNRQLETVPGTRWECTASPFSGQKAESWGWCSDVRELWPVAAGVHLAREWPPVTVQQSVSRTCPGVLLPFSAPCSRKWIGAR